MCALGPGLTQDVYEECLAIELRELEFDFKRQVPLEFSRLQQHVLEPRVRLEKFVAGLLVNFNAGTLRKGIYPITVKRRGDGPGSKRLGKGLLWGGGLRTDCA